MGAFGGGHPPAAIQVLLEEQIPQKRLPDIGTKKSSELQAQRVQRLLDCQHGICPVYHVKAKQ